jgi:hypothetical protein
VTVEPISEDQCPSRRYSQPRPKRDRNSDPISPFLYELVMWGFAEENACGERVLRSDIQARLNGEDDFERGRDDPFGAPLYVGYSCQACWEAAVNLIAYGQHLCREQSTFRCSDRSGQPV